MTFTTSTLANAAKTYYPQESIYMALFDDSPIYAMAKKKKWTGGTPMHVAINVSTVRGSRTFSTALSNASGGTQLAWNNITHAKDYVIVKIETDALRLSAGNKQSLMAGLSKKMDLAWKELNRSIGCSMYGDHGGAIGRIASGADTDTLTLTDIQDIVNFEQGMKLVSDSSILGATVSTNAVEITAIDYISGTLTAGAAWHTDFDTNDYLFRQGDAGVSMRGFRSWIPATKPSGSENFFGMDRSVNSRLYGSILAYSVASHGTLVNYLIEFDAQIGRLGGKSKVIAMNPARVAQLKRELVGQIEYEMQTAQTSQGEMADISFKALMLNGNSGDLKVIADRFCPYDYIYMLNMDTFCIYEIGDVGFINHEGTGEWLHQYDADAIQGRLGWYGQMVFDAPYHNGVGDISLYTGT